MLREEVTFTNYDDEQETKVLWFNLSKGDAVDNIELIPRLEAMNARLEKYSGDQTVSTEDMREIVDLVKDVIRISYGERDGEYFDKSPELFKRFQMTAAYDEFLWSLFNPADRAFTFVTNILPKEIRAAAMAQIESDHPQLFGQNEEPPAVEPPGSDIPPWELENREPNVDELRSMSREEIERAYSKKLASFGSQ